MTDIGPGPATDTHALYQRAERMIGGAPIATIVTRIRAIIGPNSFPASEVMAQAALNKLREGEVPSDEELTALEIVVRMMRPVGYSQNGELSALPAGHTLLPPDFVSAWNGFRAATRGLINSIGRIEKADDYFGTGFVVAPGLVATNRHVVSAMSYGTDVLKKNAARIVFKQELNQNNEATDIALITRVVALHAHLDLALLGIEDEVRPPLPLDVRDAKQGEPVVAIGYPWKDPENNPLFLTGVFGGKFGVRRAALGEALDGRFAPSFFHDCSTTAGNSGSPVFSMTSGKVLGMHRSGYFMYRNEAVDAAALKTFIAAA